MPDGSDGHGIGIIEDADNLFVSPLPDNWEPPVRGPPDAGRGEPQAAPSGTGTSQAPRETVGEDHLSEAAEFLTRHLEGSSPCQNCEEDCDLGGRSREGVGFSDLANYWRDLGVRDSLASPDISIMADGGDEVGWDKIMAGGESPPCLDFRAHELSVTERDISFDVDSFLAAATCLSAVRGLRMLFFPSYVRHIRSSLHKRFGGLNIHTTPHMHLGSALLNEQFKMLAVFPSMDWENRVGTYIVFYDKSFLRFSPITAFLPIKEDS
jgi:hypothetical protein